MGTRILLFASKAADADLDLSLRIIRQHSDVSSGEGAVGGPSVVRRTRRGCGGEVRRKPDAAVSEPGAANTAFDACRHQVGLQRVGSIGPLQEVGFLDRR
jgi:hypothetical protein